MTVQFFKTPSGEEIAILPRADYEDLIARATAAEDDEDVHDVAMYDARKALGAEGLPPEVTAPRSRSSLMVAIPTRRP